MKLDKATLDSETERDQALSSMKITENYCNEVLIWDGDVTLQIHQLQELQDHKVERWTHHNFTMESLENQREDEAARKIELSRLEVELHRKLEYLEHGCPSGSFNDQLPSSTIEGSKRIPTSQRCIECGGVTTVGDVRENGQFQGPIFNQASGQNQPAKNKTEVLGTHGRMYCAWKEKSCWEIDFLTGKCTPPNGLPSKCYRSNLLDPDVIKAVDTFQATKERREMRKKKEAEEEFHRIQMGGNSTMVVMSTSSVSTPSASSSGQTCSPTHAKLCREEWFCGETPPGEKAAAGRWNDVQKAGFLRMCVGCCNVWDKKTRTFLS